MSALYFLIPISLLILAGAVAAFLWSLRKGHYEDLQGPASSIVFDDRDDQLREEKLRAELAVSGSRKFPERSSEQSPE